MWNVKRNGMTERVGHVSLSPAALKSGYFYARKLTAWLSDKNAFRKAKLKASEYKLNILRP